MPLAQSSWVPTTPTPVPSVPERHSKGEVPHVLGAQGRSGSDGSRLWAGPPVVRPGVTGSRLPGFRPQCV